MPRFNLFKKKRKDHPSSSSSSHSSSTHASDPSYQAQPDIDAAADEAYGSGNDSSGPEMAQGREPSGPIFFRNDDHRKAMEYFKNKKYENTKTVDRHTLEVMGVHDQFFALTSMIGFEPRFWDLKEKAYNRLTAEFLSTFSLKRVDELLAFECTLLEHKYTITELELAEWFGFLPGGQEDVNYPTHIWKEISDTEQPANRDSPRSKFIHHPVLRVIQRALAQTVFARGETAIQVRLEELGLIGRIMYPNLARANISAWMINYWASIAANRRSGKGQIQIGQFVTVIAKKKGLVGFMRSLEETKGYTTMDLTFFKNAGFIKKADDGRWLWQLPGYPMYYLPVTQEIVPKRKRSALLIGYEGEAYGVPPPPPTRPTAHVGASSSAPRASVSEGSYDFTALMSRLETLERLSTDSLELGKKIDEKIDRIEDEQRKAREDIDLLKQYHEDDGVTRQQVGEMYNWWYPQYGYPPPPPPPEC